MAFRRLLVLVLSLMLLLPGPVRADDTLTLPGSSDDDDDGAEAPARPRVAPVELKIPVLGVDADIVPVGQDPDGAMTAPSNPDTVAWYALGPGTGVPGNMVLAGHVDWGGRLRVFGLIHRLGPGDVAVVVDEKLREYFYQVISVRQVEAEGAPVEEIFGGSDVSELTLITCGGAFDYASHQYLDRVVVRARKV